MPRKKREFFYFRAGYTTLQLSSSKNKVDFVTDNTTITTSVLGVPVTLEATGDIGASIAGPDISSLNSSFPAVRVGYRFASYPNLAIETILATANDMTVSLDGTFDLDWVEIPDLQGDLLEITTLSPTASLVYSFDVSSSFKPYLGVGLSYIMFNDAEIVNTTLLDESDGNPKVEFDNALGLVLQAGVDYGFYENWWLSADVRFLTGAETDVTFSDLNIDVEAEYNGENALGMLILDEPIQGIATVKEASTSVSINSVVFSLGVGMNF